MRIAAWNEIADKTVVARTLEYSGQVTAATPEFTPNEDATIYDSTVEGSMQTARATYAQLQTGWKGL